MAQIRYGLLAHTTAQEGGLFGRMTPFSTSQFRQSLGWPKRTGLLCGPICSRKPI
jgi:hypothetical protein